MALKAYLALGFIFFAAGVLVIAILLGTIWREPQEKSKVSPNLEVAYACIVAMVVLSVLGIILWKL